jgi:hypothetical protein
VIPSRLQAVSMITVSLYIVGVKEEACVHTANWKLAYEQGQREVI